MTTTQMDIFSSSSLERLKIDKPIRLIELFAGYGSQSLALKYLNADYESYRICEWNYKSFEAYKRLHFPNDDTDYSKGMSTEQLKKWVVGKGVSADWNKPMPETTIAHLGEKSLREIYNAAMATHNLVDISRVSSSNLDIERERERTHCYIMTYSFPCQDLSLAGKRMGMDADSGTRSSLLWQVERILGELKRDGRRPDILLMENVIQVHGVGNTENFNRWLNDLHDLGYTSYFQDLKATGFGIPQARNRCFVVSVLGEKSYEFPEPTKLNKTLKDMLEDGVDIKYYLTQHQIDGISAWNTQMKPLENLSQKRICNTLTTRVGAYCSSMKLIECDNPVIIATTQAHSTIKNNGEDPTITASGNQGRVPMITCKRIGNPAVAVPEDTGTVIYNGKRMSIRRLTPRECFRLMGVRDEDFDRLASMPDLTLYHLAGDSIVVNVLMAIFRNMF